jgi:HSP20 family protein
VFIVFALEVFMANLETRRSERGMVGPFERLIENFFEDVFSSGGGRDLMPSSMGSLACDISETDDAFVVSADLPGVDRNDIDVSLNGNVLTIRAERKEESSDENAKRRPHFIERRYGLYQRSFTLPANIVSDKVEADYQDGVLTLAIPKAPESKAKKIQIGSEGGGLLDKILPGKKNKTIDVKH